MIIESIELQDYRNYNHLVLELSSGTNILYGKNAQGKTNILEAMYICSSARSHRGSRDRELIRFGESEAHIKMMLRKNDIPVRIDIHLRKNRSKGIALNGVPIKRASELFGVVNEVFFSPEDLNIIKNGPSERRRFADMELCQINPYYVHSLSAYNRSLQQRNRLLKDIPFHPEYEDMLDVWDMQLVKNGREIIRYRQAFIDRLNPIISRIHRNLTAGEEDIRLIYDPQTSAEELEAAVRSGREADERQRTTLTGPHRDDIGFFTGEEDLRKYGSQGQQRTAALSLKLAEIELVRQTIKDTPILLLDDVLSELDADRQTALISALNEIQTVITCTGVEDFLGRALSVDSIFKVVQGTVTRERIENTGC